jgi:hypothetical protein
MSDVCMRSWRPRLRRSFTSGILRRSGARWERSNAAVWRGGTTVYRSRPEGGLVRCALWTKRWSRKDRCPPKMRSMRIGQGTTRKPATPCRALGPPALLIASQRRSAWPRRRHPQQWALLWRTITIASEGGQPMDGRIAIDQGERRWSFTPTSSWTARSYSVRIASSLEDVCGNSLLAAFDRPLRSAGDSSPVKVVIN